MNKLLNLSDDEYLVSFCIPIYKYPVEKLYKCLDSILNCGLDTADYEIIIISDGNNKTFNKELDKLLEYYKSITNVNIQIAIHMKNSGLFEARKTGVKLSHGSYICHVDCDDDLEPGCFDDLNDFISNSKTEWDIIQYNYNMIYPKEMKNASKSYYKFEEYIAKDNKSLLELCIVDDGIPKYIWGKLINRKVYNRVLNNMPDTYVNFAEDFLALVFLTSNSKSYIFRKDIRMYNYYRTDDSMTSHYKNINKEKWQSLMSVANVINITDINNFKDEKVKKEMQKIHTKYALELYSLLRLRDQVFESDEMKNYAIKSFTDIFGKETVNRFEKAFEESNQNKNK